MTLTQPAETKTLASALAAIGEEAGELDLAPRFPADAFERLKEAGALALPVADAAGARPRTFLEEWRAVEAVAAADGSVGRIYDAHLNGVERLAVAAPEPLRSRDLEEVRAGRRLLGVWDADPRGDEGEPAPLVFSPRATAALAPRVLRRQAEPRRERHARVIPETSGDPAQSGHWQYSGASLSARRRPTPVWAGSTAPSTSRTSASSAACGSAACTSCAHSPCA